MMRAAAIVVGVVLLLTGCTTTPVPPEMTEAELLAYRTDRAGELRVGLELNGYPVPDAAFERFIDADEWLTVTTQCLQENGIVISDIDEEGESYQVSDFVQETMSVADYVCGVTFPIRPEDAGYFTPGQRDYLYDYYQGYLVPCLLFHDHEVVDVPTRAEFMEDRPWWNPYINQDDPVTAVEAERLFPLCPTDPFDARVTVVP